MTWRSTRESFWIIGHSFGTVMTHRQPLAEIESRELFPGFKGKFFHAESMTLVYWEIRRGAALPEHSHFHEQVVNMLVGEFELTIDGTSFKLTAGDVLAIPRNAVHFGTAITDCRILDVFQPCRDDYR